MIDLLYLTFFVGWAFKNLSSLSEAATLADVACAQEEITAGTQQESNGKMCDGFSGSAFFYAMAMLASGFAAASYRNRGQVRYITFLITLTLESIALVSYYGGKAQAGCVASDDDQNQIMCQGYGGATFFFAVAGILFAVCAYFLGTSGQKFSTVILGTFFGGFMCFFISLVAVAGTVADLGCQYADDDEIADAQCDGYGLAAFWAILALLVCSIFLYFSYKAANSSTLWSGFFVIFGFYTLWNTTVYATEADIACNAPGDDDVEGNECDGYAAATLWSIVAVFLCLGNLFGAARISTRMRHVFFFAILALFYLGVSSARGGVSAGACSVEGDDDAFNATCDGYGFATFGAFCAFVASCVGGYFAFRDSTDEDEKYQEKDVDYAPQENMGGTSDI